MRRRRWIPQQPTVGQIGRVTSAQTHGLPHVHFRGNFRGWDYAVYTSPFDDSRILVHARRGDDFLSQEVRDIPAARILVGALTR